MTGLNLIHPDQSLPFLKHRMEISGMFICKCSRCLDATELGTFLSALKCQHCSSGYLLSLNPTDSFSDWRCNSCGNELNEIEVSEIIDEAESTVGFPKSDVLTEPDEDVDLLKDYISTFSGTVLHPNHYILQEVNLRIIRAECYDIDQLFREELTEFINRCKGLLDIADVLIPGFGEYRAFIQYHYFKALMSLEERKDDQTSENSSYNFSNVIQAEESLKNYKRILTMQQDVLTFLEEKFTTHRRIDYIRETMEVVQIQIRNLEQLLGNS